MNTSSSNTRTSKADRGNEDILDAALSLFIEFGLRRNTMDDVAQRAGIGRATLYRRFGDKDQLIQAVMVRECLRHFRTISEEVRPLTNPREALLESFVLATHYAHQHPLLRRLLELDAGHILPHLSLNLPQSIITLARQYISSQIRQAQDGNFIRDDLDPEQTAEHMLRLIQSFVLSPQAGVVAVHDLASLRQFTQSQLGSLLLPVIHRK